MFFSILYIFLALFGIGFLIFIHELGHYFMARRVGITVEIFAIGFGKSIYEWEHKGVKWKLGWLPFGGYVKMAGTEKKAGVEPYQIADGFFGKRPWQRIKVASMGPIVNIAFSFLAFTLLWALGGREKPFSEFTQFIGRIEEDTSFYAKGLRAGDQIVEFNDRPFKGFNDFLYGIALDNTVPKIDGFEIDYFTNEKKPFEIKIPSKSHQKGIDNLETLGGISPASYLIYDRFSTGQENPLPEGSPMGKSGIQYKDRILWVNGELVFSQMNLIDIINEPKVLLTVQRGEDIFLTKIPRLKISDLRLDPTLKGELDDWKFEAHLNEKFENLYFIPYSLNSQGSVQTDLSYVDERSKVRLKFEKPFRSSIEIPLEKNDQILAVNGERVFSSYELLEKLQTKKVLVIVQKMHETSLITWKAENRVFEGSFDINQLEKITKTIGLETPPTRSTNNLRLLHPIVPIALESFPLSQEKKSEREKQLAEQKKLISEISDPQKRMDALKSLDDYQKRLMLGIRLQDRLVEYNPAPFTLFKDVLQETWRTLKALLTGFLSPKNVLGPVGIVQVIHYGWTVGAKEALYWLAMISLNLGILNLLPIPVLDGGHICFALVESVTKKPIKAKTMERLIIPFVILLIIFFIYLTYNDISRLFHGFFK